MQPSPEYPADPESQFHRHWLRAAIAGAIIAVALGTTGYYLMEPDRPLLDDIYRAFQLFAFSFDGAVMKPNLALQAARFLAPAVVAYAAILTAAKLLAGDAARLRMRGLEKHAVFARCGREAMQLLRDCRNWHVDAILLRDADSHALPAGPRVFETDLGPGALEKAHVERAQYFFALSQNDVANIEAALAVDSLMKGSDWQKIEWNGFIHIEDRELQSRWRKGHFRQLAGGSGRIRAFSSAELTARRLLDDHPLELRPDGTIVRCATLVMVGLNSPAEAIILHAARIAHFRSGERLRVRIIDDEHSKARFLERNPTLHQLVDLDSSAEPRSACFDLWDGASETMNTVCVCLGDEAEALKTSFDIFESAGTAAIRVLLRSPRTDRLGTGLYLAKNESQNREVALMPAASEIWNWEMVVNECQDAIAKAAHRTHRARIRENLDTKPDDPALAPWESLDEDLRESNRQQADHIPVKLRAVGKIKYAGEIASLKDVVFTPEEIEDLARMEHARWVAERVLAGWKKGPKKDVAAKESPFIAPYDELQDEIQEYDRNAVRLIPDILAKYRDKV